MKNLKKVFLLALALTALTVVPTTMFAQDVRGGLFGYQSYEENAGGLMNQNRDSGLTIGVNTENFGETAPLGSGIAIMLLAGVGYVALKKKED